MYIVQSSACSVPNGSTPVTPANIAASQAALAALNGPANLAQSTFNALVSRTDLNTNGWPLAAYGGTPAGPGGANPVGGKPTGFRSWPGGRRGAKCFVQTQTPPMGANPASLQATAAPPAPPAPSLVTQGHPSYTPPTSAPTPASGITTAWNPPNTGYSSESGGSAFSSPGSDLFGTFTAQNQKVSNSIFQPTTKDYTFGAIPFASGMGCAEEPGFWPGVISGLSLLASGIVLYEWLKKNGGLPF